MGLCQVICLVQDVFWERDEQGREGYRVYFSTQVPKMFLVLSKQPQSQLAVKLAVTGAVVPWTVVQLGCDSSSNTMDSSPAGARLGL